MSSDFDMWAEKYRPKHLREMIGQDDIVPSLTSFVQARNVPNSLFVGPPGTGKTTAALCIAHDLYGVNWKVNTLELNASDERGIETVRGKVKSFAGHKSLGGLTLLIIIDECDGMLGEAQQGLRRIMETYSKTCRFILIANWSSKIIEPIQSRCAVFRFTFLSRYYHDVYVNSVAKREHVQLTTEGLIAIYDACEGDLRKALMTLQAAAATGKPIDEKMIFTLSGKAKPADIKHMIETAIRGDFNGARQQLRDMLFRYGVSGRDVVKQTHSEIFKLNCTDTLKKHLLDKASDADFRIVEGADEEIQLAAMLVRFSEGVNYQCLSG